MTCLIARGHRVRDNTRIIVDFMPLHSIRFRELQSHNVQIPRLNQRSQIAIHVPLSMLSSLTLAESVVSIVQSHSPTTLKESATIKPAKLFRASTNPAALPLEDAEVDDAPAEDVAEVDPVEAVVEACDVPVLPPAVVVALLSEPEVDVDSLVLVLAADPELAVLDGEASPFWASNQLAPTGSGKLAALANPAMSKPILALTSAGGKKDE